MITAETSLKHINTPSQVLFASLVGTTIEFFDFYIYATAAVLVFPRLFFPASDPASSTLASLATFGIAFLARPIGSAPGIASGPSIGSRSGVGSGSGIGASHQTVWTALVANLLQRPVR